MTEIPSVGNGVQHCENARKNSFLNYKSAALSGWLRAQNAATLYFSALGAASLQPLLPSIVLFQLLTFWPLCKEQTITAEADPGYTDG